uniref:Thioredoxin n=1 Tax=Candidatus Kentrum sp. FW TaxID=2126338 RepID=A0A450TBU4_9GAMM|nr:MAG: thioredoxin [Candidatus Kentron sp. FW]
MSTSEFVFDVDEQNFPEIVLENSHRIPVLVDFWASWCAPCRMLAPILTKLAEEFSGAFIVAKVNTDEQRQLASQYQVQSLPTVKIFRNGAVSEEFLGAQPEHAIRQILDRHVERESDQIRVRAITLHEQGNTNEAIELLQDARVSDPANERVSLDLAGLLLKERRFTEVDEVLREFPDKRQMDSDVSQLRIRVRFSRIADSAQTTAALEDRIAKDPGDCEAHYQLGARRAVEGDYEVAMNHFLEIMRKDRSFQDDAGRKGLVDIFALLGAGNSLVSRYRSLMSSMLH